MGINLQHKAYSISSLIQAKTYTMSVVKSRKSVLITGCSPGGIGHALAREFHAKGLHVIATARTKEAVQDLEALGMSTLSLEVTSSESIADARMQVEKLTGGKLDILVNNRTQLYHARPRSRPRRRPR